MNDHMHYSLFGPLMDIPDRLFGPLLVYALAVWALWRCYRLPPGGQRKRTRNSAIILLIFGTIGLVFMFI